MRIKLPGLLLIGLTPLILSLLAESAKNAPMSAPNRMDAVYVKGNGKWHPLDELIGVAWQYLTSKTNVPAPNREVFVVWIDRENTNQIARISFGGEIGKQFWEVRLGPKGQPEGYITGSAGDRTTNRLVK